MKNNSKRRSPEIEAIYIETKEDWTLRVKGVECAFNIDEKTNLKRNLITPSLKRLSPNAFTQEKIQFSEHLWSIFSGDEEKDEYTSKGLVKVEVVTSEGTLKYEFSIEVEFDEIPF